MAFIFKLFVNVSRLFVTQFIVLPVCITSAVANSEEKSDLMWSVFYF